MARPLRLWTSVLLAAALSALVGTASITVRADDSGRLDAGSGFEAGLVADSNPIRSMPAARVA